MSILVLQSSWWGRESWLLCLICLPGVSWWLSGSSSRCHGVARSLWLWYFLIILTYYFWGKIAAISHEGKLYYFIYKVCEKIATEEQALDHSPILVEKTQISVIFSSMAIMSGQIFMKMILCTFVNIYSDNLVCSWYQIIYGMIGFAKSIQFCFYSSTNLGIIQRERGKEKEVLPHPMAAIIFEGYNSF